MKYDLSRHQQHNALAFTIHNGIRNENDEPIEFKLHKFLAQPYMDNSPELIVRKAGQIGFSTLAIIRALHLAYYRKANIIYTLPSKSIVKDFVTPKVDPLIANNPVLRNMVGDVDSMGLKKVGDRFVYFRSSWDEASGIAISADILINDELDRSNPKAIRTYKTRLDASKMTRPDLGWNWKFSNPRLPGSGVDEEFSESDQKTWMIKCSRCNQHQSLEWPDNIDLYREVYICSHCKRDLSPEDRNNGHWVKKYFGRSISGYTINQLMANWHSASKIIQDSRGDQEVFHNFTLGLPYQPKDHSVSRSSILDCVSLINNPMIGNAMGVDVGKIKHYVIMNKYGIFRIGSTESWEEIEFLINQYNAYTVIDAMPNPDEPAKLAKKYRGKVFIHYYAKDKKQVGTIRWGEGDDFGVVQSDRTKIIDHVVAQFANREIQLNLTEEQLEEFIKHWGFMYRVVIENEKGAKEASWLHPESKPDHYPHAQIYATIALEKTLSHGAVVLPASPGADPYIKPVLMGGQVPTLDIKRIIEDNRQDTGGDWRTS